MATKAEVSLIPFLEPGDGKFHLDIAAHPTPARPEDDPPYPFSVLNDSDPFSRLIGARVVSGNGRPVSSVFILAQRDDYFYRQDELWALNNRDLDRYWQQTFSFMSSADPSQSRLFPLAGAQTPEGGSTSFQPVFFCTFRQRFFHPLCPSCGKPLALCEDDSLLLSSSLMPYSTSLRRYLYCPSCKGDGSEFYSYARAEMDPPIVRDRHELILAWRTIATGRTESLSFPCATCPEQTACYGKSSLCSTRIVPFLFYPSHLLTFTAMSMSAADFLPLLSGAPLEEVLSVLKNENKTGRRRCLSEWQQAHPDGVPHLFSGHKKQFLEILYLKLSFLGDVSQLLFSRAPAPVPVDLFTALDSLWVTLPDQSPLLPGFWNFKTTLLTVGPCLPEEAGLRKFHPSQRRSYLGMIWFFTLLKNKKLSVHGIHAALDRFLQHPSGDFISDQFQEFAPENIFWDTDSARIDPIPPEWCSLWVRALSLGIKLLAGGPTSNQIDDTFSTEIEAIRGQIREILFFEAKQGIEPGVDRGADAEIFRILSGITARLMLKATPAAPPEPEPAKESKPAPEREPEVESIPGPKLPPPPHTPEPEEEEALTQTVMLSGGASAFLSENLRKMNDPATPSKQFEEELQETVIFRMNSSPHTPAAPVPKAPPPPAPEVSDEENDVAETLILKPPYNKDRR